jgi:large subunit ribosomal protein L4
MEISIVNIKGEDTGRKLVLNDEIFGIEPNDHVIYLDVKLYLANQRQGTHKSKERGEISGSTRKLKKQKGTGTARSGSIKSPLFVGGGRVFGPRPRDYEFKLNKKVKVLARKSALAYKAKGNSITVLADFVMEQPKTKEFIAINNGLKLERSTLYVLPELNENIYLASRNLPGVKVTTVAQLNTYEIMRTKNLVFIESSVALLEQYLTN